MSASPAEDVGPLLRASGDRGGADQPRLCGRAVARGEIAVGGVQHGLAGGAARRQFGLPFRATDHRPRAVPGARTGAPACRPRPATRSTSGRWCWCSTARTTSSCSTRSSRSRAAPWPNYDLVIASQPYRARASLEFKAKRVVAPLAKALGPGGRLIAIHSHGHDPGMEIIRKVWPDDNPFVHDRHQIMKDGEARARHRRPRPQLQRLCG